MWSKHPIFSKWLCFLYKVIGNSFYVLFLSAISFLYCSESGHLEISITKQDQYLFYVLVGEDACLSVACSQLLGG